MPQKTTARTAAALSRAAALTQGNALSQGNPSARELREIVQALTSLMVVLFEQADDGSVAEVHTARLLLEQIEDGLA